MNLFCWLNLAFATPQLPLEIAEWTDWVKASHPEGQCIDRLKDNCMWLGSLQMTLQVDEGNFEMYGVVDAPTWIPLPGNQLLWPVNLKVNEKHVPVIEREQVPNVYVEAGPVKIEGTIVWNQIPHELPIPKSVGLLDIVLDGQSIPIQFDERHQVLLQQDADTQGSQPLVTVSRLWQDGPTPTLTTHISVQNSGKGQTIHLGGVHLDNGTLIETHGSMSSWVSETEDFYVYAPNGTHHVEYVHAIEPQLQSIPTPSISEAWPSQEHWVIHSQISQRQLNLSGLRPVSTSQSSSPQSWHTHPTYIKDVDTPVEFDVLLRGNPTPPPNRLHQHRQLWPKLNSEGFWVQDSISGQMTQDWILQPPSNLNIQAVEQGGFAQSVVTDSKGTLSIPIKHKELNVTVTADTSSKSINNPAWNLEFDSVDMVLWIPNSWTLIYWEGLIWKNIFGMLLNLGLAAFLAFLQREDKYHTLAYLSGAMLGGLIAPVSTLIWLMVSGVMRKTNWLFILSVGWGICALQESQTLSIRNQQVDTAQHDEYELAEDIDFSSLNRSKNFVQQKDDSFYTQNNVQTIQMGIGLPTWQGTPFRKSWSSQTDSQDMSLLILEPHHKRWIAMLAALFILSLSWFKTNRRVFATISLFAMLGYLTTPQQAMAENTTQTISPDSSSELPSKEIEELLIDHLYPDLCQSECINIALSQVTVKEQALNIWMEVHASEASILTLPGPMNQWPIHNVNIEGTPTYALRTTESGFLQVKVPKGVWSIDFSGPIHDGLQLRWPVLPHRMDAQSENWTIHGLQENGQIQETIGFSQDTNNVLSATTGLLKWQQFVQLGTQWTILNTLERNKEHASNALSIPLNLPRDAQVLSTSTVLSDDQWYAVFPKGETKISWNLMLPIEEDLILTYENLDIPTALTWKVKCDVTVHCLFEGPPPTTHTSNSGQWVPTWHPYPGESLHIKPEVLNSKLGETTQIQSLHLTHALEEQWITSTATINLESSAQNPIEFTVSDTSKTLEVTLNNEAYPFQPNEKLTILTTLGVDQMSITWKTPSSSWTHTIPSLDVALPIANSTITIRPSSEQSVVWATKTWGTQGPPQLTTLILIVFMALALARHPSSKYSFIQWLVVAFGMTQVGWVYTAILILLLCLQSNPTLRWRITIDFAILVVALLMGVLAIFVSPPTWIWNNVALHWYQDVVHEIPEFHVVTIPKIYVDVLNVVWILWMLGTILPTFIVNLKDFVKQFSTSQDQPTSPKDPSNGTA